MQHRSHTQMKSPNSVDCSVAREVLAQARPGGTTRRFYETWADWQGRTRSRIAEHLQMATDESANHETAGCELVRTVNAQYSTHTPLSQQCAVYRDCRDVLVACGWIKE